MITESKKSNTISKKPNSRIEKNLDEKDKKIQELEEENLHLRIHNGFLKELRRMRIEEESRNKKKSQ